MLLLHALFNLETYGVPPTLRFEISSWVLFGLVAFLLLIRFLLPVLHQRVSWRVNTADLSLLGLGNIKVERNEATRYIANRVYLELMTRKAALLYDEEHDTLLQVYDSLYQAFANIREELKSVPGQYLQQHRGTAELIKITLCILNDGLRPHLTRYQARFRAWYALQLEDERNQGRSPQEIQREFPEYEALVIDLRKANQSLMALAKELYKKVVVY